MADPVADAIARTINELNALRNAAKEAERVALLREGFEAGWHHGFQEALTEDTRPWTNRCEEEFQALLAQRREK